MTRADGPAVAGLCQALGYACTPGELAERFEALEGDAGHWLAVAEEDGVIVGWLHARIHATLTSVSTAELTGLVVVEGARRRGVGQALVLEARTWAQAAGCARMRVRSNVNRDDARRFYERLGFSAVKNQTVFDSEV